MHITLGSTAGKKMLIDCPVAEIDPSQRDSPESDMLRYTANFVALGSGTGENEVSLLFA
jgi:hypothetical protein